MEKNTSKKGEADMNKPCIEYICACAWCEVYIGFVESLKKEYEGRLEVVIYKTGIDFDYIKKYGAVTKSMLVINESKAIKKLSRESITAAFEEAIQSC